MEQEIFSLEDDDYGDMFITQSGGNNQNLATELDKSSKDDVLFLGLEQADFTSPCVSQFKSVHDPSYSDISGEEDLADFEIPSSQKRWVHSS